ncbi:MAG: ribosomal-processing cysteine protease Prp [Oscillospiraceae bacterium]|nr:ribosomal-processing cysteine protease Prp [Oscillospiraceae bacterium]
MTTVTFRTDKGLVTGFTCQGHSGFGDAGTDVVCAAVTSAIRYLEATVNDALGLAASVRVRDGDPPSIVFRLPGGLSPELEETTQAMMTGLMVYLSQLHNEYPDSVEVYEA